MSQPHNSSSSMSFEAQIAEMIDRAERASQQMLTAEYRASSVDEMVTAVVGAAGILKRIELSQFAKRRLDNLSLGDAIVEAVLAAEAAATRAQQEMMSEMMGGNSSALQLFTRAQESTQKLIDPEP